MDGLDRADRLAEPAVDALVRLDVEGAPALIDAIDRTCREARLILHVDAGVGDDIGHGLASLPDGLALLDEGAHAFAGILRLQGLDERRESLRLGLRRREMGGAADHLLDGADG